MKNSFVAITVLVLLLLGFKGIQIYHNSIVKQNCDSLLANASVRDSLTIIIQEPRCLPK